MDWNINLEFDLGLVLGLNWCTDNLRLWITQGAHIGIGNLNGHPHQHILTNPHCIVGRIAL